MVINGEQQSASAKSAFIPKTGAGLFLENEHWFSTLNNLLYKAKNGRVLSDNTQKYVIYQSYISNITSSLLGTRYFYL